MEKYNTLANAVVKAYKNVEVFYDYRKNRLIIKGLNPVQEGLVWRWTRKRDGVLYHEYKSGQHGNEEYLVIEF